jgi:hypothetical protein
MRLGLLGLRRILTGAGGAFEDEDAAAERTAR